jgi:hypothetical protein
MSWQRHLNIPTPNDSNVGRSSAYLGPNDDNHAPTTYIHRQISINTTTKQDLSTIMVYIGMNGDLSGP